MDEIPNLYQRLPPGGRLNDADGLLEIFLEWAMDRDLELYPAQEEAILEVFADRHVVLNTPTGSGKSLVALAMHLHALARGRRSFYTSPIKALVSEKFFDLCRHFGAEQVGMMTGDASINAKAPIICCTAEVLAALALSEGDAADVGYAILDEFHYYGDRDRGMAWQIPLLTLPRTTFMLMSATLGDTADLRRLLQARTGREVSLVRSARRPVPLHFSYSEEPLLDAIQELVKQDRAPIYVVDFTQRACAELAQNLMSLDFSSKEQKRVIADAVQGFRFDTPYGKRVQRHVLHGVGIHHAGLLPKYRLLVEQLAQRGLLKVICGTDTLGVGINVPLRTVLFTRLCKYDGRKTGILSVRDFQQIAGRAGRKGFDDVGWVVCQAPEHVIENKKIEEKIAADPGKRKKLVRKRPPDRGYAHWDEETYRKLIESDPEALTSRFRVSHGMILNLLQRPDAEMSRHGGYGALLRLIDESHEAPAQKARLRRESAKLFKALRTAGVAELVPRPSGRGRRVRVSPDLQRDFSLHHSLSLFLLFAVDCLDREAPDYPLRVLTLVEAILEDPQAILLAQQDKAKTDKLAELKAEGVEYEQRMEALDKITWPMPDAEMVLTHFDAWAATRPWVRVEDVRLKSIARDMYERYASFNEYVNLYGVDRIEGVLLRHLNQTYKTLIQAVPEAARTEPLDDLIAWLRTTLQRTDASLLTEWKRMVEGVDAAVEIEAPPEARPVDPAADRQAFMARVRAELHAFAKSLAVLDYEEAAAGLRQDPDDPWDADRIAEALRPFFAEYDRVVFDHRARAPTKTLLTADGHRRWRVRQVLCDPLGDDAWYAEGMVDLSGEFDPEAPLVALTDLRG